MPVPSFDLEHFGECTVHLLRKCPPNCEAKWRLITNTPEGLQDFVAWLHEVVLEGDFFIAIDRVTILINHDIPRVKYLREDGVV